MTYEEAIKILGKGRALCMFNPLTGASEPMNEDCRLSAAALDLAIEALEKQIPKKPKDKFTVPYDTLACGICPYCGEGVNSDMKFCSECGQRLNWSNDEET